jgi:hypothetical protein
MLLTFEPVRGEPGDREHLDPLGVVRVTEERMHVGTEARKVARLILDNGDKLIVLDDDRSVAKQINAAREAALTRATAGGGG